MIQNAQHTRVKNDRRQRRIKSTTRIGFKKKITSIKKRENSKNKNTKDRTNDTDWP